MGIVEQAIVTLTDRCDGAVQNDGQGWNGADSHIGHSFANQIRSGKPLTWKQRKLAAKIIRKYHRQFHNWDDINQALPGWVKAGEEAYQEWQQKKQAKIQKEKETLPKLSFSNGYFFIKTTYNDNWIAKEVPQRRWVPEEKAWRYLNTDQVKQALMKLSEAKHFKEITPEANEELFRYSVQLLDKAESQRKAQEIKKMEQVELDIPLKTTLFEHQKKAAKIGTVLDSSALLMEQGTGKTLAAIAIATHRYLKGQVKRLLIVAPKSVLPEWARQFEEHTDLPYQIRSLEGMKKSKKQDIINNWEDSEGLQVIVINYESVWRLEDELKDWAPDMIICDESQKIKKATAKQSKALHRLGKIARYKLILTGTPVTQSPLDFYSQYLFLDPSIFGTSFSKFRDRYAVMGGYQNYQIIDYKNLDELAEKAHSIAYRVTKEEALDLPDVVHQTLYAELEPKAKKLYKELAEESILKLQGETVTAPIVLTQLLRLQQIAGGFINTEEGTVVQVSNAKLSVLKDKVEDLIEAGKKIVIFARFIPEIEAISKTLDDLGIKHHTLTGKTKDRGSIISDFQNNPETKVFLAQTKTGGVGITLTAADTAIFYSKDYSLEAYLQALARIHRLGQTKKVTYLHIVAQDTVDEEVTKRLIQKEDIATLVVDDLKDILLKNMKEDTKMGKLEEKLEELKKAIEKGEEVTQEALDELNQEAVAEVEVEPDSAEEEEEEPKKRTKKSTKKKEKADKEEEETKPKKNGKSNSDEPTVTVADLAEELGVSPAVLRKKLRSEGLKKPDGGRWEWPEDHPDLATIRAFEF